MAQFTIRKTNAVESQQARMLVYGDSGCGKTTSILTLPPEETLVIITEPKYEPLLGKPFDFIQLQTWDDCVEWLREASVPNNPMLRGKRYLAFDSLTSLADLCKNKIIEIERPGFIAAKAENSSREIKATSHLDAMELQDFGALYRRLTNYILGLLALPVPVIICTAMCDIRDDKSTGQAQRIPMIGGKLGREVVRFFGQVLYMGDKTFQTDNGPVTHRIWYTANEGNIRAKDSSGKLHERGEKTDWMNLTGKLFAASQPQTKE